MLCQVCHRRGGPVVCDRCSLSLRSSPARLLDGEIGLVSAFLHLGAATTLVHHLKYRGVGGYPDLVARILAPQVPSLPLVPVPRALSRRVRYGVDPARLITAALARHLDVPVLDVLRSRLHTPRRAGGDHSREVGRFRLVRAVEGPVMVVDDVVTTGSTLLAAIDSIGRSRVVLALSANVVPKVSSLRLPNPGFNGFSTDR